MKIISITKPIISDLPQINAILAEWNDKAETEKYSQRILNEIKGIIEFNMKFWVIKENSQVIGIGGLANCQPKLKPFLSSSNPLELKAIYLENKRRHKGYGKQLVDFLTSKALKTGCQQLLLISASKYEKTAYNFYQKIGFSQSGWTTNTNGEKMAVFSKLLNT